MAEPVIDTPTEPATMTPAVRFIRTLLQIAIALVPALVTVAWANLSAEQAAIVTGALVAAISAAHNAINQARSSTPARRDRGDIGVMEILVIVLVVLLIVFLVNRL